MVLRKQSDKENKPEQGRKERKKDERLQEAEDHRKRRRQRKRNCWQDQMKTVLERQTGDGRGREQPSQRECAFNLYINPAHLPNRASLWPTQGIINNSHALKATDGETQKEEAWGWGEGPSAKTARMQEVNIVPFQFKVPGRQRSSPKSNDPPTPIPAS